MGAPPPPCAACDPAAVSRRKGEAWRSDRLTLNKEVLSPQVVEGFVPLLSEVGEDFVRRARAQVQKSGRERWTADFSHELFRFALECEPPPRSLPNACGMGGATCPAQLHPQSTSSPKTYIFRAVLSPTRQQTTRQLLAKQRFISTHTARRPGRAP